MPGATKILTKEIYYKAGASLRQQQIHQNKIARYMLQNLNQRLQTIPEDIIAFEQAIKYCYNMAVKQADEYSNNTEQLALEQMKTVIDSK